MSEVEKETTTEEVVVEPSPVEEQARSQGWVSKAEWKEAGKNEDEWRPAREFVERGELFKSIHSTKRELKHTQAALTSLQRHHQFVFEKAYNKAVGDLKKERRAALQAEDLDRADAIESEIEDLTQKHQQEKLQMTAEQAAIASAVNAETVDPKFQVWVNDNQWYDTDPDLREYANAIGIMYVNTHPEARTNPDAVLKHVVQKVKQRYPEKFGVKKSAPNPVAASNKSAKAPTKKVDIELDETEQQIMQNLVRSGVMTEEQYITELKKVK